VWLSEREFVVNVLGFLSQHLVVLLDPSAIVPTCTTLPALRLLRSALRGVHDRTVRDRRHRRVLSAARRASAR
jgi:hypothetical protein